MVLSDVEPAFGTVACSSHGHDGHGVSEVGKIGIASPYLGAVCECGGGDQGGKNWQPLAMPHKLTWLQSIAMAGNGSLWVGGREGVFYSEDHGQNWSEMSSLPPL